MIREHDRIILTVDVPGEGLKAGDVGTVIHVHGQDEAYEVEFVALDGETLAVETLRADQVRPIGRHEMPHARLLAG